MSEIRNDEHPARQSVEVGIDPEASSIPRYIGSPKRTESLSNFSRNTGQLSRKFYHFSSNWHLKIFSKSGSQRHSEDLQIFYPFTEEKGISLMVYIKLRFH